MSADQLHLSSGDLPSSPSVHSSPPKPDYSIEIPTELWEELCEYPRFSPWFLCASDYSNLSLACKRFRDIFQKRLFRSVVHIPGRYAKEAHDGNNTEAVTLVKPTFCEKITQFTTPPPAALKWMQDYRFCGMNGPVGISLSEQEKKVYEAAVISLAKALPKFTVLRRLTLEVMDIEEELVAAIAGLSSLCSLDIDGGRLIYRAAPLDKQIVAKDLWFNSRKLEEERNLSPLQLFSNQRLASLGIAMPSELSNILTHFADQGCSERLRKLSLYDFDFEEFPVVFRFLGTTPNLEILRLRTDAAKDSWIPVDVLDTLTTMCPAAGLLHLLEYEGPPELAPLLIPNSPVCVLYLEDSPPWIGLDWEKGNRILDSISRSWSVRILGLPILPPRLGLFPRIAREFPNLEHLILGLDDEACVSWEKENADQAGPAPMIEMDGENVPLSSAESFKGLVERLSLGLLPLPAHLKSLEIRDSVSKRVLNIHGRMVTVREYPVRTCMTRRALHRSACDLGKLYASLEQIEFAQYPGMSWRKDGEGSWRPCMSALLPDLDEQAKAQYGCWA